MHFQQVSGWQLDLIVDSIPDIIASCVVIGFGVNVFAFSTEIYVIAPQLVGSLIQTITSDICMVYKHRCEWIVNHCTQFIKFKQASFSNRVWSLKWLLKVRTQFMLIVCAI